LTRHDPAVDGPIQEVDGGAMLYISAFPKAKSNEISGVRNGRLMVKVTAVPEDGKANDAIARLLAKALKVAVSGIVLANGTVSREKSFLIDGATVTEVAEALGI
jgi:uncharacterized protein (TIGR00251 family)